MAPYLLQALKFRYRDKPGRDSLSILKKIRNSKLEVDLDWGWCLLHKNEAAQWAAALALRKIDDPGVVLAFKKALVDSDKIVCALAATALQQILDPQIIHDWLKELDWSVESKKSQKIY